MDVVYLQQHFVGSLDAVDGVFEYLCAAGYSWELNINTQSLPWPVLLSECRER